MGWKETLTRTRGHREEERNRKAREKEEARKERR